jgi:hypothetical protein
MKEEKWAASYVPAKKYQRAGIWMLVSPIVILILTLVSYSISAFVFSSLASAREISPGGTVPRFNIEDIQTRSDSPPLGEADIRHLAGSIVNAVFGLIGILALMGIVIGIPLGLVFLFKKELAPGIPYDERSGKGSASSFPEELRGWNWGAAGLSMIWGTYYSVWMFLIGWIPLVGFVWWIVMGLKGNEWAWRKYKWISVEQFKHVQRKWMPWGITFFVLWALLCVGSIAG